jgi:two-component system NarL family response regulator
MKVLLVDDNALFLEGLKNMLEASGVEVLGMALNAREAVELTGRLAPEVVLMDIQMPGDSGIAATGAIKALYPNVKIVMMTVAKNDTCLFDAIAAGACGYLLKNMPEDAFLQALKGMARGESPLSPGLAAKVLAEFSRRAQSAQPPKRLAEPIAASVLSERQQEVLRQVAAGRSYKEIAAELGLSEATIKYHMGEITARLHLENRAQVIACATRLGLAQAPEAG